MSIYIKNAVIITSDKVIKNGCLLTEGNRIAYVGGQETAHEGAEEIDARGGIVLPGLINTHTHAAMTYFRSFASDLPLNLWLDHIIEAENGLDDEIVYYGTLMAAIEAMENGCTFVNDMYFFCNSAVKALAESGIRGAVERSTVDVDGEEGLKRRLREQKELEALDGAGDGRINSMVSLHAEYTCSERAVRTMYEHAAEVKKPLNMHISETKREVEKCRARHNGMSPLEWLESLGVLDCAPTVAAHCVAIDDRDIDVMLRHNVGVAHCPTGNLKLASGIAPVPHLMERGVNVALGTDGCGSNNNIDMMREMFLCSILHKGYNTDASLINARTALTLATENGARMMGVNAGRLEAGALADITVLRPSELLMPMHDPLGILVYSAEARDVRFTVVDGKITVREGRCCTLDREKVAFNFRRCADRLFGPRETVNPIL